MRAVFANTVHFGRGILVELEDGQVREFQPNRVQVTLDGDPVEHGWYEADDREGYVVVPKRKGDGSRFVEIDRWAEWPKAETKHGKVALIIHGTGMPSPPPEVPRLSEELVERAFWRAMQGRRWPVEAEEVRG